MSSEVCCVEEKKRGIKRSLDESQSDNELNKIEPSPKRRKLFHPQPQHQDVDESDVIMIDKNEDEQSTNTNADNQIHEIIKSMIDIASNQQQIENGGNGNGNCNCTHSPNPNNKMDEDTDDNNSSQQTQLLCDADLSAICRPNWDDPNKHYDYLSIYTDERCLVHAIPDDTILEEFNERPARLQALIQMIDDEKWNECCRFIPKLDNIPSITDIEGLHTKCYLNNLYQSCNKMHTDKWNVASGSDTYIVKKTLDAALISAGLVMEATKHCFSHIPPLPFSPSVDAISENKDKLSQNTDICEEEIDENMRKYAVVLNRPPGHHCDGKSYSGYCYINNTAVAIEKELNMDTKVLVLDVDVHHGDGTQKLFYSEPTVLTVSFHQYDGSFFPISGTRTEYGPSRRHQAYGTNINIPLGAKASDLDVLYALRNMVWNIVKKFQPKIAYLSLGTDGVAGDKANNSTIFTPSLYGQIAYELQQYVKLIVVTTEGGYTTKYLSNGMNCVLHGLTGQIDDKYYPAEVAQNDVLSSTVHTVAATISDLRRVYEFEQDPMEISKIFNGRNGSNSLESSIDLTKEESMYIPEGEEDDIEYNEYVLDDDEVKGLFEDVNNGKKKEGQIEVRNGEKKKKKKKDRKHKDKKKKKKKKDKHKKDEIDLTKEEKKEKKSKKKKKHKKDKKKKKKKKKHKKEHENGEIDVETISLIEDSPMTNEKDKEKEKDQNENECEKKRKRKRRRRHKKKSEKKEEGAKSNDENGSDIHNRNINIKEIDTLSITDAVEDSDQKNIKIDINGNGMNVEDNTANDNVIVIE